MVRILNYSKVDGNFERKFQLGDYVKVVGAELENGLLHISNVTCTFIYRHRTLQHRLSEHCAL